MTPRKGLHHAGGDGQNCPSSRASLPETLRQEVPTQFRRQVRKQNVAIRRGRWRFAQAPVVPAGGHLHYWDSGSGSASAANSGMEISNHWGAVDRDTQVRGPTSPHCAPSLVHSACMLNCAHRNAAADGQPKPFHLPGVAGPLHIEVPLSVLWAMYPQVSASVFSDHNVVPDCEPVAAAGHPGTARGHGSEPRGPVLHPRDEVRQS